MTTTIMLSDRSMVAPGTPFRGEDLPSKTLKSRLKNKTIQLYDSENPPARMPRYPMGKTELGLKKGREVEGDGLGIGMHRRPPETKSDETKARITLVRAKLKVLGVTMPPNARLDTMEARLVREEKSASVKVTADTDKAFPGPAQGVWDADPVELAEIPEGRLLTVYRERCEEYHIKTQKFDSKDLLIAYMSSQFVKK